ncbi:uncharacterized protein IL334_003683 [Kwoniella shivajii]|uniref:Uncharacterized protein n=1 Tax=Kwoniella shivajii TaxID=564305 RepID=A0ABZ1CYK2_9TREE|nr:hypothetical protein IL334_003683 [Kwoniella shivajii]
MTNDLLNPRVTVGTSSSNHPGPHVQKNKPVFNSNKPSDTASAPTSGPSRPDPRLPSKPYTPLATATSTRKPRKVTHTKAAKSRESAEGYSNASILSLLALDKAVGEPSDIPLNLIHFFTLRKYDDPSDPTTEKRLNERCEENEVLLSLSLARNNIQIDPPRTLEKDCRQAIPSSCPALGFKYHLLRLDGTLEDHHMSMVIEGYRSLALDRKVIEVGYCHDGIVRGHDNPKYIEDDQIHTLIPADRIVHVISQKFLSTIRKNLERYDRGMLTTPNKVSQYAFSLSERKGSISKGNRKVTYGGLGTTVLIGKMEDVFPTYPHIDQKQGESVSVTMHLSGPSGYMRFPQLNVDVKLEKGFVVVAPLGTLLHHLVKRDKLQGEEESIVAVCYTRRDLEDEVTALPVSESLPEVKATKKENNFSPGTKKKRRKGKKKGGKQKSKDTVIPPKKEKT